VKSYGAFSRQLSAISEAFSGAISRQLSAVRKKGKVKCFMNKNNNTES
jgi:hypothetical protein